MCSPPPSRSSGSGGRFYTYGVRAMRAPRGLCNVCKIRFPLRRLFLRLLFRFHLRLSLRLILNQSHVRNVNRAFALGDLALRIVLRFPKMLLNNPHAFNQNALLRRQHFENFSRRTFEVPRDHFDLVAFFDVKFHPAHNTSGANETIFMKFRSRSSRATGPKMRVPRGFKSLSMITIALLSKRRNEPSSRRIGCRVRTKTARTTSPFFTVPVGLASFTFAVITSPTRA